MVVPSSLHDSVRILDRCDHMEDPIVTQLDQNTPVLCGVVASQDPRRTRFSCSVTGSTNNRARRPEQARRGGRGGYTALWTHAPAIQRPRGWVGTRYPHPPPSGPPAPQELLVDPSPLPLCNARLSQYAHSSNRPWCGGYNDSEPVCPSVQPRPGIGPGDCLGASAAPILPRPRPSACLGPDTGRNVRPEHRGHCERSGRRPAHSTHWVGDGDRTQRSLAQPSALHCAHPARTRTGSERNAAERGVFVPTHTQRIQPKKRGLQKSPRCQPAD